VEQISVSETDVEIRGRNLIFLICVSRAGVLEGLALHAVERKGKGTDFRCRKYNWLDEGPGFLAFCHMKI
jgi:hypothetical protein